VIANHLSASHEILVKYYNKRTASQEILFVYFEIYILLLLLIELFSQELRLFSGQSQVDSGKIFCTSNLFAHMLSRKWKNFVHK